MAIAIEGFSIVALRDRIEDKVDGGFEAVKANVTNARSLHDDHLWRCSFMVSADAGAYAARLSSLGLNGETGPDPDFVLINEFDKEVSPYCEWLRVANWDKGVIAWLEGTDPKKLMAYEGWSPEKGSGLTAHDPSSDHIEHLRTEGNVEVYWDKQSQQEIYQGRTGQDPEKIYDEASRVIGDNLRTPGGPELQGQLREEVATATKQLQELAKLYDPTWQLHFCIGKGLHAQGDAEGAYEAIKRAYEMEHETESVFRELAGICLELGRADEAATIGEKAAALRPDNSETLGNLAVAYLLAGEHTKASATIDAALKLNPADGVNKNVRGLVTEVASGARSQPSNLFELTQPKLAQPDPKRPTTSKKRGWWQRLQFWK